MTRKNHTPTESSLNPGPHRKDCIRLVHPDRHNGNPSFDQPYSQMTSTINTALSSPHIDYLECLLFSSTDGQYETCLIPRNTRQSTTAQATIDSFDDSQQRTAAHIEDLKEAIDEHHPRLEYGVGQLDLSPVTESPPILTSRLLAYDQQTLSPSDGATSAGVLALLFQLINNDLPHLYQVIIEPASGRSHDYNLTARLAVADRDYGIVTDDDLENHLYDDYQYDIAEAFPKQPVTSNFQLPTDEIRNQAEQSSSLTVRGYPVNAIDKPVTLEKLATSAEFNYLITGSSDADPRYRKLFNHYGRIPIHGHSLNLLTGIIHQPISHSPWKRVVGPSSPTFHTRQIPPSAGTTTGQRYGTATSSVHDADDMDQSTSESHRALINEIVEHIITQGYSVLAVDQKTLDVDLNDPDPTETSYFPGESQPDVVAKKDDTLVCFEAEINDSNPAAFLKNLERAYHFDYDVVVVAQDSSDLEPKLAQAERPYNHTDTTNYGVRLYNLKGTDDMISDQLTYLLPRDSQEAKWYLDTDGTITLLADDRVLAQGDAEASLDSFEYACPRCVEQDDVYVVRSASGEHLVSKPTKAEAIRGFTKLNPPFIPQRLMYLDRVEFQVQTGDGQLRRWRQKPRWAQKYQNNPGKRHEHSTITFIDLVTTKSEGNDLYIPEMRRLYNESNWHDHKTKQSPPGQTWFSRGPRDEFEATDTESRKRKLLNRTLQFPQDLDPELPDFPSNTDSGNSS